MNDLAFTFAVDKPIGLSSRKIVNIVSKNLGIRKVGHGGTLDPLATGVLVIAVGRSQTKKLFEHVEATKEYEANIFLGKSSTTDDEEGEKYSQKVSTIPSEGKVKEAIQCFVGSISQIPPIYSAVKIRGQEAYKRARRGEEIAMQPREVDVQKIRLVAYEYPHLAIKVTCGKGVYIRSLARDLGDKVGTGGYLEGLRRTRVGTYTLSKAIGFDDLEEFLHKKRRRIIKNSELM